MWHQEYKNYTCFLEYGIIVDRHVCANTDGLNSPQCCNWRDTIQIKRCHGIQQGHNYYVYKVLYYYN